VRRRMRFGSRRRAGSGVLLTARYDAGRTVVGAATVGAGVLPRIAQHPGGTTGWGRGR